MNGQVVTLNGWRIDDGLATYCVGKKEVFSIYFIESINYQTGQMRYEPVLKSGEYNLNQSGNLVKELIETTPKSTFVKFLFRKCFHCEDLIAHQKSNNMIFCSSCLAELGGITEELDIGFDETELQVKYMDFDIGSYEPRHKNQMYDRVCLYETKANMFSYNHTCQDDENKKKLHQAAYHECESIYVGNDVYVILTKDGLADSNTLFTYYIYLKMLELSIIESNL